MNRKSRSNSARVTRRTFSAGVGAAAFTAGIAPFNIVRAQGGPLKVGVLLPRSGLQAGIGQDCQRGVDIAPAILKSMGLPDLAIMNGDTEFERRHRARASGKADRRRRPAPGRRLRFRADHRDRPGRRAEGHSARHQYRRGAADHRAGLQVRVPELPDRGDDPGRRFRQPEGGVRCRPALRRRRSCSCTSTTLTAPRSPKGSAAIMPKFDMPYTIVEEIPYDPAAHDLSVEVTKAKATNADALLVVQPAQRRDAVDARTGQAALDAAGDPEHGAGLVRGPIHQDAGQARRRSDQLRSLVRSAQEAQRACSKRPWPRPIRA